MDIFIKCLKLIFLGGCISLIAFLIVNTIEKIFNDLNINLKPMIIKRYDGLIITLNDHSINIYELTRSFPFFRSFRFTSNQTFNFMSENRISYEMGLNNKVVITANKVNKKINLYFGKIESDKREYPGRPGCYINTNKGQKRIIHSIPLKS